MTMNETIDRIGQGLRQHTSETVQAPLPAKMRDLLDELERLELRCRRARYARRRPAV